jgi:hypothetical protein
MILGDTLPLSIASKVLLKDNPLPLCKENYIIVAMKIP